MMKPRTSRTINERPNTSASANKAEVVASNAGGATNLAVVSQRNQTQMSTNQQNSVQAIRKRRSSINVYDQPSSLNSRLRQLETDMLRLDEDRTKLFDDTHSALAQYELRLNEIHSILKSRQDNVEKYVEDMKLLLTVKEEFERQAKILNEKHDRIHEKFMHRETTISREIKLLKNKFELLEKNRQFKGILQQKSGDNNTNSDGTILELDGSSVKGARNNSEAGQSLSEIGESGLAFASNSANDGEDTQREEGKRRPKLSALIGLFKQKHSLSRLLGGLLKGGKCCKRRHKIGRRKDNRVSSINTDQLESTSMGANFVAPNE